MGYRILFHKKARLQAPAPLLDRANEEMDITRLLRGAQRYSSQPSSTHGRVDHDWTYFTGMYRGPAEWPRMQAFASGGQHEDSAAYVLWPPSGWLNSSSEERAAYFNGLQKEIESEANERVPGGQQASTLLDLMTIRAFHSKALRRYSLGTALGFRTRHGVLTSIPAIIVFVARKVHKQWLLDQQILPILLEGPGGVWCDVDVVEFSYYGAPTTTPKEQIYTELVEGLRGNDPCIGSGSQVASQETYGTLGAIVQSQTGFHQLGFLTNRHVAVDLDFPTQKMFHPLPPNLGPGVYLGAVERATSFIRDDLWYGIFAAMNPETFVRADGAFIPFTDTFDLKKVTTTVKGLGEMGEVKRIDLQAPIDSVMGKHVVKVGRSSGLTKGVIMAYALEYNDEKGICFFTDFLIVGENELTFDLEGDSGSLILLTSEEEVAEKPRPIGIIWGGTANRGRLKLRNGHGPENWTSGVDLGRLLDLLQLDLITTNQSLQEAIEVHQHWVSGGLVESPPKCFPVKKGAMRTGDVDPHMPLDVGRIPHLVPAKDLPAKNPFEMIARPSGISRPGPDLNIISQGLSSFAELDLLTQSGSPFTSPAEIQEDSNSKKREMEFESALSRAVGPEYSKGVTEGTPDKVLFDRETKRRCSSF